MKPERTFWYMVRHAEVKNNEVKWSEVKWGQMQKVRFCTKNVCISLKFCPITRDVFPPLCRSKLDFVVPDGHFTHIFIVSLLNNKLRCYSTRKKWNADVSGLNFEFCGCSSRKNTFSYTMGKWSSWRSWRDVQDPLVSRFEGVSISRKWWNKIGNLCKKNEMTQVRSSEVKWGQVRFASFFSQKFANEPTSMPRH